MIAAQPISPSVGEAPGHNCQTLANTVLPTHSLLLGHGLDAMIGLTYSGLGTLDGVPCSLWTTESRPLLAGRRVEVARREHRLTGSVSDLRR